MNIKRLDEFKVHSAGIYIGIRRETGLGLIVSHWTRDSNLDREDDTRVFLGLNLTHEF